MSTTRTGAGEPATAPRQRFVEMAGRPDPAIDLGEAALLVAAEEYEGLEVETFKDRLDDLAMTLEPRVMRLDDPLQRLGILSRFLHEDCGFIGNEDEYYDPRNSFLNDVIDRRVGIPLSLSVVYLEVARRVGIPLVGVGFPAHFLLRHDLPMATAGDERATQVAGVQEAPLAQTAIYIDAYHGGRLLDGNGCQELLAQVSRGRIAFEPRFLEPVSNRQILVRMLTNLKAIYFRAGEHAKAVAAIDRILLLSPGASLELRDRGAIYLQMEVFRLALADFERYLATNPPSAEREPIMEAVHDLRRRVALLN